MTEDAAGRRQNPPPAARSALTPSLSTSPATGASAGSLSWGGQSHRRVGRLEPAAPPTASEGQPDEASLSVTRGRPSHWAPHGGVPPAGPLGRGELLITSSSPHSSYMWLSVAAATTILLWRGEATTRMTLTCRSNPPPCWPRRRSTTTLAMDLHWRRRHAPRPSTS
jgi:hypothetical protein